MDLACVLFILVFRIFLLLLFLLVLCAIQSLLLSVIWSLLFEVRPLLLACALTGQLTKNR